MWGSQQMESVRQTNGGVGRVARTLWTGVRLPILGVLVLFEGAVQTVLGGLAFFIFLTALFFEYATPVKHFPFWTMMAISGGCLLAIVFYYVCIRVLSE